MKIRRTKSGIKVRLEDFPTVEELEKLNTLGTFTLDTRRGYKRLLQHIPSKRTPCCPCVMECPIKEEFTI